jgi:hypothetical protein
MPFLLPPNSPLPKDESGRARCGAVSSVLASLDADQQREHLEFHARTCDDTPGKFFAACPFCTPLRTRYINGRIEDGTVRWLYSVRGEHEFGNVGEGQDEVRQRLVNRVAATHGEETGIVVIEVPEDQVWAQIRDGAKTTGAREAADVVERETVDDAVQWIADRESVWLLERYSE